MDNLDKSSLRKKCPYPELLKSKFREMWARITPNTDTFQAVYNSIRRNKFLQFPWVKNMKFDFSQFVFKCKTVKM